MLTFQDVTAAKMFSDEAGAVFERATSTLLKNNMLLYFAYADFEEGRMKYEKVHQIYEKFLEMEDIDPTLVCKIKNFKQKVKQIVKFCDFPYHNSNHPSI